MNVKLIIVMVAMPMLTYLSIRLLFGWGKRTSFTSLTSYLVLASVLITELAGSFILRISENIYTFVYVLMQLFPIIAVLIYVTVKKFTMIERE